MLVPNLLLAVLLAPQGEPADPSAAFFERVRVVQVELRLDEASRQALRERPREYAKASVVVDIGGSILGICGAMFGTWMMVERAKIAEVRARLDASGASAAG
ncbi:MAG: hypothetical protein FJZ38_26515 [Candidatus Rokubacteria bacterium]|nr:hypothetical protein [Candidatus Rokubacteria bacterium]